MPTLATFNANNFFLRHRFANTFPGDEQIKKSLIEAAKQGILGYLPGTAFGKYPPAHYVVWDPIRRELAARALREPDGQLPDIICFQEVENIQAIRAFNQRYLGSYYPYSLLIDAYDPRNIDVGVLSRFPLRDIRSHIDELNAAGDRVFSRDCLEAEIELPGGAILTLFINHLKSKYCRRKANESDAHFQARIQAGHDRRQAQAQRIFDHVSDRFEGEHTTALYAVVGDFNDTPWSPYVDVLTRTSRFTDLVGEHRDEDDCWTYYWRSKGRVSQIDYVLASRALARRVEQVVVADASRAPHIERQGVGFRELNAHDLVLPRQATLTHYEPSPAAPDPPAGCPANHKIDFRFPRYPEVLANWKENISDHCPVKIWF